MKFKGIMSTWEGGDAFDKRILGTACHWLGMSFWQNCANYNAAMKSSSAMSGIGGYTVFPIRQECLELGGLTNAIVDPEKASV